MDAAGQVEPSRLMGEVDGELLNLCCVAGLEVLNLLCDPRRLIKREDGERARVTRLAPFCGD